jgi:hypothetical protein
MNNFVKKITKVFREKNVAQSTILRLRILEKYNLSDNFDSNSFELY